MKPFKHIRHLLLLLLLAQGLWVEAQHYVPINGEVDSLMVLPKLGGDSVYWVNESLTVQNGGTLLVEGGVKMYFGQSAYLRVDNGNLLLEGSRNDSIYLLCYEFSHDWAGIQLKNISEEDTVRISHVEVVGALTALNASTSNKPHARVQEFEVVVYLRCRADSRTRIAVRHFLLNGDSGRNALDAFHIRFLHTS